MAKTLDGIVHRFTVMPPECTEKKYINILMYMKKYAKKMLFYS